MPWRSTSSQAMTKGYEHSAVPSGLRQYETLHPTLRRWASLESPFGTDSLQPLSLVLIDGGMSKLQTWGVARASPQAGMGRAFGPRHSEHRTQQASAREESPNSRAGARRPALLSVRAAPGGRLSWRVIYRFRNLAVACPRERTWSLSYILCKCVLTVRIEIPS